MDCVKCSEVGISAVNTTYTGYLSVCSGNAAHMISLLWMQKKFVILQCQIIYILLFWGNKGEPQGRGSLVGYHLWGHTELDMTKVT